MADIETVRKIAFSLGLRHISDGVIDLTEDGKTPLEYLQDVLGKELEYRTESRVVRFRQKSKMPRKVFDEHNLSKGLQWQLEHLKTLNWVQDDQNVIILGKCGTGKTSLAVMLGEKALYDGYKVFYATMDSLLVIIKQKEHTLKAENLFKYMRECSVIIVDDMLYSNVSREEAHMLYRALAFFNECRSLVIISNRDISAWHDASEDRHLIQTMQDRLTANCQIIRL
ncbi:MAG: ATP-binding protein [Clostridia bacterium]|nr:ATP-binding protein [Clostridia bacterium]